MGTSIPLQEGTAVGTNMLPSFCITREPPGAWITIKAEHKGAAVLDCEMLCDSYINLYNASYILIQDLVITRGYKEADPQQRRGASHHIARQPV